MTENIGINIQGAAINPNPKMAKAAIALARAIERNAEAVIAVAKIVEGVSGGNGTQITGSTVTMTNPEPPRKPPVRKSAAKRMPA